MNDNTKDASTSTDETTKPTREKKRKSPAKQVRDRRRAIEHRLGIRTYFDRSHSGVSQPAPQINGPPKIKKPNLLKRFINFVRPSKSLQPQLQSRAPTNNHQVVNVAPTTQCATLPNEATPIIDIFPPDKFQNQGTSSPSPLPPSVNGHDPREEETEESEESYIVRFTEDYPMDRRVATAGIQSWPPIHPAIDLGSLYDKIDDALRMSRLEDPKYLIAALRLLVRTQHRDGDRVLFPIPAACDKMYLRSAGLPSDPEQLRALADRVFSRRQEPLDLDDIFSDFVKAHGRIALDYSKPSPDCYIITRH